MSKERIGFVGLGMMGLPMARNLVEDGYEITVFDLNDSTVLEAQKFGSDTATSAADVARISDIVITMVPDSEHVEAVISGKNGILEGLKPGSVVIDMSTIDPEVGKQMAALIESKGSNFVDAPVTGGVMGAEAGTLSILVGGNAEAYERSLPILNVLGGNVAHMGPVGSGHTTKIANQIIGAAALAGVAEAFVLAKKSGLDIQAFYEAVKDGAGRSWALETLGPKILDGDFTPGFMVKHMQKDLRLADQLAAKTGTAIPTSGLIAQLYRSVQVSERDADSQGHQALVQAIEMLSNEQARK